MSDTRIMADRYRHVFLLHCSLVFAEGDHLAMQTGCNELDCPHNAFGLSQPPRVLDVGPVTGLLAAVANEAAWLRCNVQEQF